MYHVTTIDDERAVVVRMILRSKSRRPVVATTSRNCCIVKRLDHSAIRCRESDMTTRAGFTRPDPEIGSSIRAEAGRFTEVHQNSVSERRQCGLEKGLALRDVRNRNTDVIEHSESSICSCQSRDGLSKDGPEKPLPPS